MYFATYMKQKCTEVKGEIDNSTIIVGDFNISLSFNNRRSRQNINKETEKLNIINQVDLTDIHPIATGYAFFSSMEGTFSRIDHNLGYKTNIENTNGT